MELKIEHHRDNSVCIPHCFCFSVRVCVVNWGIVLTSHIILFCALFFRCGSIWGEKKAFSFSKLIVCAFIYRTGGLDVKS